MKAVESGSVAKAGGLGSHIESKSTPEPKQAPQKTESIMNQIAAITRQVLNLNPQPLFSGTLTTTTNPPTTATTFSETNTTTTQPATTATTFSGTSTAATTTTQPTAVNTATLTQYGVPPSVAPYDYIYAGQSLPSQPSPTATLEPIGYPNVNPSNIQSTSPGSTPEQITAKINAIANQSETFQTGINPNNPGETYVRIGYDPQGDPYWARQIQQGVTAR